MNYQTSMTKVRISNLYYLKKSIIKPNLLYRWKWRFVSPFGAYKPNMWVSLENVFKICAGWSLCQRDRYVCCLCSIHLLQKRIFCCWKCISSDEIDVNIHKMLNIFRVHKLNIPCSLPWNQSTLHSYAFEASFTLFNGETYISINGTLLLLFISICLHHQTFYKIFRRTAAELNIRDQSENNKEKTLRKLILFHVPAKKWVKIET